LPASLRTTTGVTLYDSGRTPLAWAGRVFEFPVSHADDPAGVFVQVDPFGPRLIRVEALPDRERSAGVRPVIVVAEQSHQRRASHSGQPETFVLQTSVAPVTVRPRDQPVGEPSPSSYAFVVRNAAGQSLLSATVSQNDVEGTRREWNQLRREGVEGTLALALLLAAAAVLEARRWVRSTRAMVLISGLLAVFLAVARLVTWLATRGSDADGWLEPPFQLVCTGLFMLGLTWLVLDLLNRWRVTRLPMLLRRERAVAVSTAAFFLAGGLTAVAITFYAGFIREIAARAVFDVRHFRCTRPTWCELERRWARTPACRRGVGRPPYTPGSSCVSPSARCRSRHSPSGHGWLGRGWIGIAGRWVSAGALGWNLAVTVTVGLAPSGSVRAMLRRASQATRLGALYVALLLPAVAITRCSMSSRKKPRRSSLLAMRSGSGQSARASQTEPGADRGADRCSTSAGAGPGGACRGCHRRASSL
jgi:hypothetical protein